jgi:hypothetical protein
MGSQEPIFVTFAQHCPRFDVISCAKVPMVDGFLDIPHNVIGE